MDKRTKTLLIIFGVLLLAAAGYYGYNYFGKKPPAPTKLAIVIAPPRPRAAAPSAPKVAEEAKAGSYVPVIKAVEKGREAEYASPEDFLARTGMSTAEVSQFANRRMDDLKAALDAAKSSGNKDAQERADKDLKLFERLAQLAKSRATEQIEFKAISYSSLGKRDPFMSPMEVPKVYPEVPPNAKPLERVATESIAVKAVMWNEKGYRALVVTPDGRGYTVKAGDTIGNKRGKIARISEKRVYVTEKIRDILGDVETREIVLKLYKEAE